MDNIDKLINELKSEETKKVFNKIIEERIKKENKRNERIIMLMSSIDYFDWLINFTKDKEGFTDNDWTYFYDDLSDVDKEKVDELSLFYEGIRRYAEENYIYSNIRPYNEYYLRDNYLVKVGDIVFEIGMMTGQGTLFYCRKAILEKNKKYIDFLDVLANKTQDNVSYIKESLNNLSNMINSLYESGIPIEAITNTINKEISRIISNEREKEDINDKQKVLKK